MIKVKSLFRYPVKSLGREELGSVDVKDYGLEYDRKWMLVNADNQMLTQRKLPHLTKLNAGVSDNILTIYNKEDEDSINIPVSEIMSDSVATSIWGTEISPSQVSKRANEWLSDQLNEQISLVGAGENFERSRVVGVDTVPLLFADGYPILILSQASVDYLNEKLDNPVDESRFRANILIDGCPAHSEDLSAKMTLRDLTLELIKPCKRCIMINTNQDSGEVSKEPLKTLSTYRAKNNNILFGMNARALKNGHISINETITIDLKT